MKDTWKEIKKPNVEKQPKEIVMHDEKWIDNYFWLRNRDDEKVITYLDDENNYVSDVLKDTKDLQAKLFDEMVSRMKEDDISVPEKIDEYYYYSTTEKGKQYPCFCRKKGHLEADEEIILDLNVIAKGHTFMEIGNIKISPDHKLLAYSVDVSGDEVFTMFIKDLSSGELLKDEIPNTYYGAEWSADSKVLFYIILDDSKRPCSLYRHVLGTSASKDELVFFEKDEVFHLFISKTSSKKYLELILASQVTTEVHLLDSHDPMGKFEVVFERKNMVEYDVSHHEDHLYIRTNEDALNFRIFTVPLKARAKENSEEFQAHNQDVMIEGLQIFKNHFIIFERENGLPKIKIFDPVNQKANYIEMEEPVYMCWPEGNSDFNSETFRYGYTSLVTPKTVYDYDFKTGKKELKKQKEVPGGYKSVDYVTERKYAPGHDGVMIPISLVYKRSSKIDKNTPLYLYAYGSYGFSTDPTFSTVRLSLLDRGFVFAIAHIRGGSDLGRQWYEDGKFLKKMNTFHDFISCGEHLIKEGYTSKERLVCNGGSAGGLLMGAVANLRPDLFKAVMADVPFVDVINTMSDPTIPLTVIEYEEWGNPADKEYFDYMKSYSPYDNVEAKDYPNMLVVAGLNDPRVQYWEPAKWVAKLRELKTNDNMLLLKTHMSEGHGGASGRYDYLKEEAFQYAFLLKALDML